MRRKTRPKVTWLPKDPNSVVTANPGGEDTNLIQIDIAVAGATPHNLINGAVPIVIDAPVDPGITNTSLADVESSGYRLRRIVGKCFVSYNQEVNAAPSLVLAGGGFIVLRVGSDGLPQNSNLLEYNPDLLVNDDSPWIWQRRWMLQNGQAASPSLADFPFTNAEYGSVSDGPHIDQKTARVIGHDERLFFVPSAMNITTGMGDQDENSLVFFLSCRVLATMRTTLGNRRNASR